MRKDYVHTYEFNPYEAVDDDSASSDDDLLGASSSKQNKKDAKRQYEFSESKGTRVRANKRKQAAPLVGQLGIEPY